MTSGLGEFAIQLFRPVLPMLADTAANTTEALRRLGRAAFEFKLDGARIQVHKGGDEVRVFSRRLNEVTAAVPEVVEAVRATSGAGTDPRRRGDRAAKRRFPSPLSNHDASLRTPARGANGCAAICRSRPFFFDLLYLDGQSLLDLSQEQRHEFLRRTLPATAAHSSNGYRSTR